MVSPYRLKEGFKIFHHKTDVRYDFTSAPWGEIRIAPFGLLTGLRLAGAINDPEIYPGW
jgi:hypothetical protein